MTLDDLRHPAMDTSVVCRTKPYSRALLVTPATRVLNVMFVQNQGFLARDALGPNTYEPSV